MIARYKFSLYYFFLPNGVTCRRAKNKIVIIIIIVVTIRFAVDYALPTPVSTMCQEHRPSVGKQHYVSLDHSV